MVIVVLILPAFMPALTAGLVDWDDFDLLVRNTRHQSLTPSSLRWMFTTSFAGHFQPATWLSFALDHALWGNEWAGYHLTNVLLHAGAALMFYFLARRLFALGTRRESAALSMPFVASATFAALVFAVHPLRVESVAWLAERRDVLSGFLYLLAVAAYLRFAKARDAGRTVAAGAGLNHGAGVAAAHRGSRASRTFEAPRGLKPAARTRRLFAHSGLAAGAALSYTVCVALCTLSLLAKASVVTLPFVLLVLDVYPLRRFRGSRDKRGRSVGSLLIEKVPFFLLGFLGGLRALIAQEQGGALSTYSAHDLWARLAQACHGLTFYLWKTVLPVSLSPLYQVPPRSVLFGPLLWISLAAIVLIVLFAVRFRRRLPAVPTALATYVIILSPVLGFAQSGPQLVADRYSYLSCLGLALLGGGALLRALTRESWRSNPRRRALTALVAVAVVTVLARATYRLSDIWQSPLTLWAHGVRVNRTSSIAHAKYADALARAGGFEEAVPYYERSLGLDPRDAISAAHLGRVLEELGRPHEAAALYERALTNEPAYAIAAADLARVSRRLGDGPKAEAMYARALQLDPEHSETRLGFAEFLIDAGRAAEAATLLREGARQTPTDLAVISFLAELLCTHPDAGIRNGPEAVQWASLVSEARGNEHAPALMTLATALAEASRFAEAIATAERAQAVARRTDNDRLAAELTRRLVLFREGKPYHFGE